MARLQRMPMVRRRDDEAAFRRLAMNARDMLTPEAASAEIDRLRTAIDRVDDVLVKLLNQRARYAIEIGEIKGLLALSIYAPEREKEVLAHVESASEGPLAPLAVRRLFERIIDESRSVERAASAKSE